MLRAAWEKAVDSHLFSWLETRTRVTAYFCHCCAVLIRPLCRPHAMLERSWCLGIVKSEEKQAVWIKSSAKYWAVTPKTFRNIGNQNALVLWKFWWSCTVCPKYWISSYYGQNYWSVTGSAEFLGQTIKLHLWMQKGYILQNVSICLNLGRCKMLLLFAIMPAFH